MVFCYFVLLACLGVFVVVGFGWVWFCFYVFFYDFFWRGWVCIGLVCGVVSRGVCIGCGFGLDLGFAWFWLVDLIDLWLVWVFW